MIREVLDNTPDAKLRNAFGVLALNVGQHAHDAVDPDPRQLALLSLVAQP